MEDELAGRIRGSPEGSYGMQAKMQYTLGQQSEERETELGNGRVVSAVHFREKKKGKQM